MNEADFQQQVDKANDAMHKYIVCSKKLEELSTRFEAITKRYAELQDMYWRLQDRHLKLQETLTQKLY